MLAHTVGVGVSPGLTRQVDRLVHWLTDCLGWLTVEVLWLVAGSGLTWKISPPPLHYWPCPRPARVKNMFLVFFLHPDNYWHAMISFTKISRHQGVKINPGLWAVSFLGGAPSQTQHQCQSSGARETGNRSGFLFLHTKYKVQTSKPSININQ